MHRRSFPIAILLALAGASARAQEPTAADVANLLEAKPLALLQKAPRVAVAGFRVGFVVRNGASAQSRAAFSNLGGGSRVQQAASASIEVTLDNIDRARMQAIAERAYADFTVALKASGRTLVPPEELQASPGWKEIEATPQTDKPYQNNLTMSKKTYAFVSPQALPLWFGHFDQPLGDKGPFALGNWRAMNRLSTDLGAVVVVPQIVVDFAEVSTSGNSMWRSSAEVGAKGAMSIERGLTTMWIFHATRPEFGDFGSAQLKEGLPLPGDFGEFVETTEESTKTANAVGNAVTGLFTMLTGAQGTVKSSQKQTLKAKPEVYEALSVAGAQRVGALFAKAMVSP